MAGAPSVAGRVVVVWFKMSDELASAPAARRAGVAAMGLYAMAGCHCGQHLTDGFVDEYVVRELAGGAAPARRLAAALVLGKFWEPAEQEGNPGWQFVNWFPDQPSREYVLARREAERNRQKVHRDAALRDAIQARDRGRCRYCGLAVRWNDRKSDIGGTYDHINPKGDTSLGNVVVSCRGCNRRKGKRTPKQAAMTLRPAPGVESVLGTDQMPEDEYAEGDLSDPVGRDGTGRDGTGRDGQEDVPDLEVFDPSAYEMADLSGDE